MASPQLEGKGLLASLFDLDFRYFITLKFLKVIYVVVMLVIGLGALLFFFSFASQGAGGAILGLVLAPIGALFYLVFARVYLELIALLFRIAENTTRIADSLAASGPPAGGGAPPYGSAPYGPSGAPPA